MGEIGSMPGFSHQQIDTCHVPLIQETHYQQGSYAAYNNQAPYQMPEVYQQPSSDMSTTEWDGPGYHYAQNGTPLCSLEIVEEPISKIRFRYQSEKGSHGSMSGRKSSNTQKCWPTVRLLPYNLSDVNGIKIRASLFTEDKSKPHVHKLLGKSCNTDTGDCVLPLQPDYLCSFPNLGVLFTEKKRVPDVLLNRRKSVFGDNLTDEQYRQLSEEAKQEAKDLKMNSIRICFQAINSNDEPISHPIFSEPVHNLKSPDSGELKITRLSRNNSSCEGKDEVFLLCEKVNKKDIKVKFYELDEENKEIWSDFGVFADSDVHHQVAIVFKTPPYHDRNIDKTVKVFVQLYRQNDGETSESLEFLYKPRDKDPDHIYSKRKRLNEPDHDFKGFGGHHDFPGHQNQFDPPGPDHGHWGDGSGNSGQNEYTMMPSHGHSYSQNNHLAFFFEAFAKDLQMSSSSGESPNSSQDSSSSVLVDRNPLLGSAALTVNAGAENPILDLEPPVSPSVYLNKDELLSGADSENVETDGSVPYIGRERYFLEPNAEVKPLGKMEKENNFVDAKNDLADKMTELHLSTMPSKSEEHKKDTASSRKISKEKNQASSRRRGSKDSKTELSPGPSKKRIDVRRKSEPSKLDYKPEVLAQTEKASRQATEQRRRIAIEHFVKREMIPRFGRSLRLFTSTGKIESLLWPMSPFLASQNKDGDNAVHLAVIHQSSNKTMFERLMPIVRSLMPYDVINHTNNLYQTPLHLAVAVQNVNVINWLLLSGADPNLQDNRGNTPIHMAVLKRDRNCLSSLLEESFYETQPIGRTAPNTSILNFDGYSAMHLSISVGSKTCLSALMSANALVNVQDGTSGRTPLHLAVQMQSPLIEDLLNHAKIDVDTRDYAGNTALHLACSLELYDIAYILIKAGADPSAENSVFESETAEEEIEEKEESYDNKENDEETDKEYRGRTPLDIATKNDKMVSILRGTLSEEDRQNIKQQRTRRISQTPKREPDTTEHPETKLTSQPFPSRDSGYGNSSESPDSGELKISRLSHNNNLCEGKDEDFLLCEKANKRSLFDSKDEEAMVSKLCQLLDPPNTGWEKLASIVCDDEPMVNSLRKMYPSPTLTLYKKMKDERLNLKETLEAAALYDVYHQLPGQ